MFNKILIANRGEIACRIIRTCNEIGVKTVAVYSDADIDALHVEMADEAYLIGTAKPSESYLKSDVIIEVALKSGAEAIHPGYGFLSENAKFADDIQKAGLIFIGPDSSSIKAMGGKSEAKILMEEANVPLVKGYHGEDQSIELLKEKAIEIGFPVLIKASAGGGGKGMRIVNEGDDVEQEINAATREAISSFGDGKLLIEKYLTKPRHVEVQVFADNFGNTIYLADRDCSVQRRHQKVIEEAPAPNISDKTRKEMGEAAVAAAKSIGYKGAGTVEFLLDIDESFYFMEMNTRLQVEHPVTEMVTGVDLVELQLLTASGEELPINQNEVEISGHAFEARIYAEDPDDNFLPAAGNIKYLRFADGFDDVRIDTGIRETTDGNIETVSIHYDPMIAKLITWGASREESLLKLNKALADTKIIGIKNNISFLYKLSSNQNFINFDVDTKFIENNLEDLLDNKEISNIDLSIASAVVQNLRLESLIKDQEMANDDTSPWNLSNRWRNNLTREENLEFRIGEDSKNVILSYDDLEDVEVRIGDSDSISVNLSYYIDSFSAEFEIADNIYDVTYMNENNNLTLIYEGRKIELYWNNPLNDNADDVDATHNLTAPMPGSVVSVNIKTGDKVIKGQPLIIIEAMKMEHTISSPIDGVIDRIAANIGDQVDDSLVLVYFAEA